MRPLSGLAPLATKAASSHVPVLQGQEAKESQLHGEPALATPCFTDHPQRLPATACLHIAEPTCYDLNLWSMLSHNSVRMHSVITCHKTASSIECSGRLGVQKSKMRPDPGALDPSHKVAVALGIFAFSEQISQKKNTSKKYPKNEKK